MRKLFFVTCFNIKEQSDLGLHCLPRPICPKTYGHNGTFSRLASVATKAGLGQTWSKLLSRQGFLEMRPVCLLIQVILWFLNKLNEIWQKCANLFSKGDIGSDKMGILSCDN